jgi:hypothetical protein
MDRILKYMSISNGRADAAADIALINKYAVKELSPDDVFVYSLVLCDNDVDRDNERFTDKTLNQLAPLFLGKTGISDHYWSATKQHSRIYKTEVEKTEKMNALGEPLIVLRADAYMIRTEDTKPMIDAIEGGILREVSVGCQVSECNCSICGKRLSFDWDTWTEKCPNDHIKGHEYDGKRCIGNLEKAVDAFEFSFVAVPAQRSAGVVKSVSDVPEALQLLAEHAAELPQYAKELKSLLPAIQSAFLEDDERDKRIKIAAAAKANLQNIRKGE